MMKKLSYIAYILVLSMLITGCSPYEYHRVSTTFDELPGEIAYAYSNTTISLVAASFCEVYIDHGYTGYSIATIDRSNLSDDDVYWMLNRDIGDIQTEFQMNAYLTSEKNSLVHERMSPLRTTYDDENIYFVFYTKDVYREHLNDFEISLQMIMSPDKDITADTTEYYYFSLNSDEDVDYSDYDSVLSPKEKDVIMDALEAKINSLQENPYHPN